jgi:hypothetical protein
MAALLPIGDEPAMNFGGVGCSFRDFHSFPQRFREQRADFAELFTDVPGCAIPENNPACAQPETSIFQCDSV